MGVIIVIAFIFLFKIYFIFQDNLKADVLPIFSYLSKNSFIISINNLANWFSDLFHFNYLRLKVKNLTDENIALLSQLNQLKINSEENAIFKEAFKLKQDKNWHLVPAHIIIMDPTGLTGQFWIDKGQDDGLKPGMNVILQNQVLIGILKECFNNYCRGESIFTPQIKIGVKDVNSNVFGVLERDNRGRYLLKLVPQEAKIEKNDLIITSQENIYFLPGLLVAKVKEIIPDSNVLKEYIVEPLVTKNEFSLVFVITDFIPSHVTNY